MDYTRLLKIYDAMKCDSSHPAPNAMATRLLVWLHILSILFRLTVDVIEFVLSPKFNYYQ